MGAVAGCPITAVFDGDASLRSRPMRRVLDPLALMGAKVVRQRRRRPAAADAAGRTRSLADPLPHAGGLGPDQVRGAAGGAGGAGNHHRDRDRGQPRPYRTDAEAFRRADRLDQRGQPRPQDRADRTTRTARRRCRGAGRSVIGGVSDRRGPDCRGLRPRPVGRHDQSAANRPVHHAARNGRLDRGKPGSRRCRRADGPVPGPRLQTARCRGAAGACALDDRRISGAGGGGRLCRRHHHHARPAGIAGQGIRPAGSHRRYAARQRRQGRDSQATI